MIEDWRIEELQREAAERRELLRLAEAWKQAWEQMRDQRNELAMELLARGLGHVAQRVLDEEPL
jgi:hypothetical protein